MAQRHKSAIKRHRQSLKKAARNKSVRTQLRRVLNGTDDRAEVQLEALNRRGRQVRLNVTLLGVGLGPDDVRGAILLTAPVDGDGWSGDGTDGN